MCPYRLGPTLKEIEAKCLYETKVLRLASMSGTLIIWSQSWLKFKSEKRFILMIFPAFCGTLSPYRLGLKLKIERKLIHGFSKNDNKSEQCRHERLNIQGWRNRKFFYRHPGYSLEKSHSQTSVPIAKKKNLRFCFVFLFFSLMLSKTKTRYILVRTIASISIKANVCFPEEIPRT